MGSECNEKIEVKPRGLMIVDHPWHKKEIIHRRRGVLRRRGGGGAVDNVSITRHKMEYEGWVAMMDGLDVAL